MHSVFVGVLFSGVISCQSDLIWFLERAVFRECGLALVTSSNIKKRINPEKHIKKLALPFFQMTQLSPLNNSINKHQNISRDIGVMEAKRFAIKHLKGVYAKIRK